MRATERESSGSGQAVKPLVTMSAAQLGLKAMTRDAIVVGSGTTSKTYAQGSVLPSGERVETLDAEAMVIVTDRKIIRIQP